MGSPAPGYDDSARGMASPGPARFNSPAHRARYDGERASDAAGGGEGNARGDWRLVGSQERRAEGVAARANLRATMDRVT